jgi:hypothetical protein
VRWGYEGEDDKMTKENESQKRDARKPGGNEARNKNNSSQLPGYMPNARLEASYQTPVSTVFCLSLFS